MDKEFLLQVKTFISKYKYWIVLALFLFVMLVASENSMIKRVGQKRRIHELQEQLRESAELKERNEKTLNDLNNDSLVIDRIAREMFLMHTPDEDLYLEQPR